jgi:hypothetical protein
MSNGMPWFKVWNEMPADYKFQSLSISSSHSLAEVLGVWVTILAWASISPERGWLLVTNGNAVSNALLARYFLWSDEAAQLFLDNLVNLEMLGKDEKGYFVVNWNKRQAAKDPTGAARQRAYKESHVVTPLVTREKPVKSRVEDKRTEDRGQKKDKVQIPESLNTPEFIKTWDDWTKYRSEIKHKLPDSTAQKQLAMLAKHPAGIAMAMIEQSIEKGWQGLFEINDRKNGKQEVNPFEGLTLAGEE